MGRVQQEIGAGLVGLDIAVLARADVAPQPQRERCAVAAEQAVPHQTACQADVPRGQAARVAAVGVFLPQTRVQAECCIFGQLLGQGGVQCVQSLDDDHAVPRVDALGAAGPLNRKIKHRCVTSARFVQCLQAGVQPFKVKRLQALVVVAAVRVLGVFPFPDVEIVKADDLAAVPAGGDSVSDLVRGRRLARGGRTGQHDNALPRGQHLVRDALDLVMVVGLAQSGQLLRAAGRQRDEVTADEAFAMCNVHRNPPRPFCGPAVPQSGQCILSDT